MTSRLNIINTLDNISDAFIALDNNLNIIHLNRAAERFSMKKREDLTGKSIWTEFPELVNTPLYNAHKKALSERTRVTVEGCYEPMGMWIEVRIFPTEYGLEIYLRNISEQKNKALEVLKAKEFFGAIFNEAAMGIGIVNIEGRPVQCNKALTDMLGYSSEELSALKFVEFTHPEDRELDLDLFNELVNNKRKSYQIEKRYITKAGDIVWGRLTVSLILDEEGSFEYAIGMVEDITESKKAAEELKQSTKKVKEILESISDAFFALDREWHFIYVNKQAGDLLQKDPEALVGKKIWKEFNDTSDSRFKREYTKAIQEQKPVVFEELYEPLKAWLSVHAYPTDTTLSVYFRDITEQRLLNEKLKESQEQLSLIFETTPNGILLMNKYGDLVMANKAAEDYMGISRSEAYGRRYDDPAWNLYTLKGDSYPCKSLPFALVMEEGRPVKNVEFVGRRTDGTETIFSCNAAPLHDSEGNIANVLITLNDITEIKRAEQKAKIINQKLETLSNSDGLTGISNRRFFDEYVGREWKRCLRQNRAMSLIMVDIDYFKKFNDTYGHLAGDKCLKDVAQNLKQLIKRPGDLIARYGGEEFAVVLPDTDEKGAEIVADRLRRGIEKLFIPNGGSKIGSFITISLGVASVVPNKYSEIYEVIEKADKALYKAKQGGRNRVCMYGNEF